MTWTNRKDPMLTAFGQASIAEERCVIWSNFAVVIPDRLWRTTVTGTGAVSISNGRALVAAGTNGTAELRSRRAVRYLPGQGVVMRMTAPMPAITAATGEVYIGLGSLTDGVGFMRDQDEVTHVWVANNGNLVTVPQADWSHDKADGNGKLPLIDWTLGSPLTFKFQWLGYGAKAFGLVAPDGTPVLCHIIEYANSSAEVWARQPSWEAFVRASNTTGAGAASIYCPSIGVYIEGPNELAGILRGEDQLLSVAAGAGVFVPLLSLRCQSTWTGVGGTPENRSRIIPADFSLVNEGSGASVRALVLRNATLTGSAFASVGGGTQSIAAYDTTATAVTYNQTDILRSFGVGPNGSAQIDFLKYGFQLNPGEWITLAVARSAGGAAFNVYGGVTWTEQL